MNIIRRGMIALAVLALTAASAWAAKDGFEAPAPEGNVDWPAIGITAVAALAIAVLGFKSAKRTHLD